MAPRVLVAKPGLDGHDRGAKIVARTLRDAGFEVIYTGIRRRIEDIVSIALQEDVALVGLSILSGAHVALTTRTVDALREADAGDIAVVVGGTIPESDVQKLLDAGAAAVFPTGTPLETLVRDVRALTEKAANEPAFAERASAAKFPGIFRRGRTFGGALTEGGAVMRLGVMIGAERGDMARKVSKLVADIEWAEAAGMDTAWMPQVPNDFDCLTMVALMAAHTSRIELGTAVVPLQAQHPIALARQALSVHAMAGGRLALGVGPSHHWIVRDMLGIPYEKPAAYTRDYLEVLNPALAGPGDVDVENDTFTVHNPTVLGAETPMPVLVSALGPVMLQIAGELADGTVLWMADERAIGEHIAPRITKAADNAGRPAPRIVAGIPVCLCANSEIDAAKERANRILAEAETSPNYQRLLDRGEARDVGDLTAAGDEESILARFRQFADAGVTDLSVRLLPIGDTRDELIASKYRTREVIAEIAKAVR